jgi:cytoskeletal protein CcmA (bactofilin family)
MREAEITLISEGTALEGTLELASVARVHGSIRGKLVGSPGSLVEIGRASCRDRV